MNDREAHHRTEVETVLQENMFCDVAAASRTPLKKGFSLMPYLPHAEPTTRAIRQYLFLVPKPGSAYKFASTTIHGPQVCSDQRYRHRRALRITKPHSQTGSTATYSMNMKLLKTRLLPTKSSLHNYSPYIDHDSLARLPLSRVRIETNLPSSFLFVE
jgi:hypothetical protein